MEQYKRILLKEFDSKQKVITELINLEAILNLPKGTELYLSDIHGEFEAFDYILRTCAGNLNEKINDCFGEELGKAEKDKLTLLIAYPQEVLNDDSLYPLKDKNWYGRIIQNLFTLLAFVAAKYTRSKVRKALPPQYTYIMEELLYTDRNLPDNNIYFETIQNYLIDLGEANAFILALSKVIRQLIIDHLHIVGDIFDRGAAADKVMNELMAYHSVDIQWGNHDIIWMGAFFGSKECLLTLLRIAARYGYLYDIERAYGLNLRPLVLFAEKTYSENAKFKPNLGKRSDSYAPKEILQLEKVHQALAIIQFKLESQLIQRRPEFDMAQNVTLDKIDYWEESILVGGKKHFLANTCFQTINPQKPEELTDEEEEVVATLLDSFQHSLQLKGHISFLMKKGSMYKIYNNHLLFHGCIPLGESGDFEPLQINEIRYTGKELLDFFEYHIRESSKNPDIQDDFSTDLIWYCWNGKLSPLFGKDKMTTLERYFIEDKETHIEKENPYFSYRNSAKICKLILEEFGLFSEDSRIVNGHTPVKTLKGESPIRGEGMLFVIDGGLCEAYQKKTGTAGYSLLNNSYGFQIVTHQPFQNVQKMIEEALDLSSLKRVIEHVRERTLIKSTTIGQSLIEQQQELSVLLHEFYDY
ncbi:fructose-bisphosphatase class III [Streptococcus intermedius]|uniref:fructose-bisphosphatase class III n=1 Tax=Streptococcus intermedius TaxID=1338 RepID=UPI00025B65E6|nr:fructose-bisphosphatase class III [Streptococcus intermedius]EID83839.1 firmicute fructose-1,6-bisphosphatase [Streptococcus intermedius SK54 = ATCC 27335]EPH05307.1 fructose-1,6-bisphosphatase class 3 [Streptococcus intermedius SK54 = ATCC 27335]BAM23342.1 firmicute fructose-1,6-bisphosphatase [Streptococcus intermedius JTH08]SQH51778.1 putative fructose-1,6-bisphosphatase III [Streptococcus intermedius]